MDLLIFGDTERCSELRHELPLHVGDPFLYAEVGDRRIAVVWSIEGDRIAVVEPSVEIVPSETISVDDLIEAGVDYYEVDATHAVRSVQSLGITRARVPDAFPLRVADALRAAGIELLPDQGFFDLRRRRKTAFELDGIRRATRAGEASMRASGVAWTFVRPGSFMTNCLGWAPAIKAGRPIMSCSEWIRSPSPKLQRVDNCPKPAAREPLVWMTPLGEPVVPEVKMITASCSVTVSVGLADSCPCGSVAASPFTGEAPRGTPGSHGPE